MFQLLCRLYQLLFNYYYYFKLRVGNYNSVVPQVIDEHAPVKTKTVKIIPTAPWFYSEYASLRRRRRKAEKKYGKSGLIEDKNEFTLLHKQTTELASEKKSEQFQQFLQ